MRSSEEEEKEEEEEEEEEEGEGGGGWRREEEEEGGGGGGRGLLSTEAVAGTARAGRYASRRACNESLVLTAVMPPTKLPACLARHFNYLSI